jgi:hypothetical protein
MMWQWQPIGGIIWSTENAGDKKYFAYHLSPWMDYLYLSAHSLSIILICLA